MPQEAVELATVPLGRTKSIRTGKSGMPPTFGVMKSTVTEVPDVPAKE